ncbi:MAG: addiction module toxin, HicA family [bacterium (Candidatus Stahlbacteria) CG08_land_8_20_14_0_20_40_26]|nr:MAG: addiction module toxin, HicA family [bacterium (Candidatus Stahlbacteria) CG23_combo_of_CG06-09_8_20_14_all_40_9]PIS26306.1 MAG: addiction module toxin, HicA family [bacterium (Candidatus Stahlbacteria) CG08_land_8_20_14_0_20_40_26]
MKRKDFLRHLISNGCELERKGKKHTLFYNPVTSKSATVPRHKELNTFTAKAICKDLGIPIIKTR